jgi:hypothetical protein
VAERGHYLVRRRLGEATGIDEEKHRFFCATAAETGWRIDALGSALCQM